MAFGTNTTFGIAAGKDVDTPAVTVGYKRQELVLMPLVANEAQDGKGRLVPCKMSETPTPDHPCLLGASRSDGEGKTAKDSYSVLASFGASFDGGSGGSASAKGGMAQYFATGMAAQLLALSGGAALVSTGAAAQASALQKPDAAAIAAVTGDPALAAALGSQVVRKAAEQGTANTKDAVAVTAQYLDRLPIADFPAEIGFLASASGLGRNLTISCPDKATCLANLEGTLAGRDEAAKLAEVVRLRILEKGAKQ